MIPSTSHLIMGVQRNPNPTILLSPRKFVSTTGFWGVERTEQFELRKKVVQYTIFSSRGFFFFFFLKVLLSLALFIWFWVGKETSKNYQRKILKNWRRWIKLFLLKCFKCMCIQRTHPVDLWRRWDLELCPCIASNHANQPSCRVEPETQECYDIPFNQKVKMAKGFAHYNLHQGQEPCA